MREFRNMDIQALVKRASEFRRIKRGNEMAGAMERGAHRGEIG